LTGSEVPVAFQSPKQRRKPSLFLFLDSFDGGLLFPSLLSDLHFFLCTLFTQGAAMPCLRQLDYPPPPNLSYGTTAAGYLGRPFTGVFLFSYDSPIPIFLQNLTAFHFFGLVSVIPGVGLVSLGMRASLLACLPELIDPNRRRIRYRSFRFFPKDVVAALPCSLFCAFAAGSSRLLSFFMSSVRLYPPLVPSTCTWSFADLEGISFRRPLGLSIGVFAAHPALRARLPQVLCAATFLSCRSHSVSVSYDSGLLPTPTQKLLESSLFKPADLLIPFPVPAVNFFWQIFYRISPFPRACVFS